jgi:hypothetical protein
VEGAARNFGADVCFEADFLRGEVESRGAENTVGVEQRHCRQMELGAHSDKFLRQGCAFEKAESGTSVEFDVHRLSARNFHHRDTEAQRKPIKTPTLHNQKLHSSVTLW